jgi:hypothetical protein
MRGNIPGFTIHICEGRLCLTFDSELSFGLDSEEIIFQVTQENNLSAAYLEAKIAQLCLKALKVGFELARKNPPLNLK